MAVISLAYKNCTGRRPYPDLPFLVFWMSETNRIVVDSLTRPGFSTYPAYNYNLTGSDEILSTLLIETSRDSPSFYTHPVPLGADSEFRNPEDRRWFLSVTDAVCIECNKHHVN